VGWAKSLGELNIRVSEVRLFTSDQFDQLDYIIFVKHTAWRVDGSAGSALVGRRLAHHQVVVFRGDDIHTIEDVLVHLLVGVIRNRSAWNKSCDHFNLKMTVFRDLHLVPMNGFFGRVA
jgi:hypothetical protein